MNYSRYSRYYYKSVDIAIYCIKMYSFTFKMVFVIVVKCHIGDTLTFSFNEFATSISDSFFVSRQIISSNLTRGSFFLKLSLLNSKFLPVDT
jgi:hypothetical protein